MIAETPRVAHNPQGLGLISSDDGIHTFSGIKSSPEKGF
jgi:hypothetical protein